MYDAVVELRKTFFVLGIVERLWVARVCEWRFGKNEFVDDFVERVEPYLKEIEFVEKAKTVVDHFGMSDRNNLSTLYHYIS